MVDLVGAGQAVAAIAGAFGLGGGSAGADMRDQRIQNEKAVKRHPKNVRIGAERAGFNPLTYLLANGSPAGVGLGQTLGTTQGAWEAVGDALTSLFGETTVQDDREKAVQRAERDRQRATKFADDAGRAETAVRVSERLITSPMRLPKMANEVNNANRSASAPYLAPMQELKFPALTQARPVSRAEPGQTTNTIRTPQDAVNETVDSPVNVPLTFDIEPRQVEPVRSVPLTAAYRTGGANSREYTGLNPDAFEIGVSELIGGSIVHGGALLIDGVAQAAQRHNAPLPSVDQASPDFDQGASDYWGSMRSGNLTSPTTAQRQNFITRQLLMRHQQ